MRIGGGPQRPAPYLNSKDQRRLLGMVLTLSALMFAVMWAARPESWHWLIPPDNETANNTEAPPAGGGFHEDWDRLVHSPGQNSAGSLSDAPTFQPPSQTSAGQTIVNTSGENPFSANPLPDPPRQPPASTTTPAEVVIPPEWLETVNDQLLGVKAEESAAYYRILGHISRLDTGLVSRSGRQDVLHVNLIHDPAAYRGQLLTVRGNARRIVPIHVSENEFGVKQAYEVWLTTKDSGSDPWRVVTTHLDPRLPVGEQVFATVSVTGYFFKQYSYASQGGIHIAPLLLAANVDSYVVPNTGRSGTGLEPYILGIIGITIFIALISVYVYTKGDRRFKRRMARQFPLENRASQQLLDDLKDQDSDGQLFSK